MQNLQNRGSDRESERYRGETNPEAVAEGFLNERFGLVPVHDSPFGASSSGRSAGPPKTSSLYALAFDILKEDVEKSNAAAAKKRGEAAASQKCACSHVQSP